MSTRSHTPKGRAMREAILDAAVVEFTSQGYRQASVGAIAARAGITKGGLVHHFPTKDSLLEAVLTERTARRRLRGAQPADPPSESMLEELRFSVQSNQRDHSWPRFFSIMVAESLTDDHPAHPAVAHRYEATRDRVAAGLAEELGLEIERARTLASLFMAVMDGLQIQALLNDRFDMEIAYDFFVRLVREADKNL